MTSRSILIRWAVDISQWKPSIHDVSFAASCVQPEERERLMRFHYREDFNASLVGRLLMRKFIRDLTGLAYDTIQLDRDNRGKPILVNPLKDGQHVDFNISHQGSFSVLTGVFLQTESSSTLTDGTRVGVDVMKIEYTGGKPLNEFFRLMNRNFSSNEWRFIRSRQTEFEQTKAFMRNWCLKECYVKNIGIGITSNLQEIDFHIHTEQLLPTSGVVTDTKLLINNTPLNNWIFEEHLLNEKHCAAISIQNLPHDYEPGKFKFLTVDDLLKNAIPLQALDEFYGRKVICKEFKNR